MSRQPRSKEELELQELHAKEQQLLQLERQSAETQRRLAQERSESERTMPPLEEVQMRALRKQHELVVSRGEVGNILRTQNRSLLMLFLLFTATCTLVWWGMKLMQGG